MEPWRKMIISMDLFADFLSSVSEGSLVELGVGFNFKVALRLKELGMRVIVVDRNPLSVRAAVEHGLDAFEDDLFSPSLKFYAEADTLYSVRPTPELVPALVRLAESLKKPLYILPFTGDRVPGKLINYAGVPIYALDWNKKRI